MYNSTMAEIHARRRLRLRQLIEQRFDRNLSRLARAVDLTPSHFGNVFSGRDNLGEHAARQIEKKLGLADRWMDREPPAGTVSKTPYKARTGPRPKVLAHAVEELLAAGYTQRATAQELGVHESTVSRAVQRERAVKEEHKPKRPRVAA
jgi:plasmid maintenance system antidote protein VapI